MNQVHELSGAAESGQVPTVDDARGDAEPLFGEPGQEPERQEPVAAAGDDVGEDVRPCGERPRIGERPAGLLDVAVGEGRFEDVRRQVVEETTWPCSRSSGITRCQYQESPPAPETST